MMRSLPSALGTRINTGPDINMTMRTDSNLACKLAKTPGDVETTACDVREGTIALADSMGHGNTAMQLCIGRDTIEDCDFDKDRFRNGFCRIPCPHAEARAEEEGQDHADRAYCMDVRDCQYYRDLGDARSSLEYYLRYHQVAIFFDDNTLGENILYAEQYQPHLRHGFVNGNKISEHKCTTRRNSFFFSRRPYQEAFPDIILPAAETEIDIEHYSMHEVKPQHHANPELHVFHVQIFDGATPNYLQILHIIDKALKSEHIPKVSTSRNPNTVVPAVHLTEAGVALTYGHMSQKNGDTAFTANIFSARTDVNGPFRAQASHDVFWLYNCELRNFNARTHERHKRVVLTPELLNRILDRWFNSDQRMNTLVPYIGMPKASDCMTVDRSKTAPGTGGGHPEFVLATRAHKMLGMDLLHLSSLRDMERVFGKIVSGGDPYSSIDWVNGAGTEL